MKITKKLLIASIVVVMSLSSTISKTYASTVEENESSFAQESIIDSALNSLTDLYEQGLQDNNDIYLDTNEVVDNKDEENIVELAREKEELISVNLVSAENTDTENSDSEDVDTEIAATENADAQNSASENIITENLQADTVNADSEIVDKNTADIEEDSKEASKEVTDQIKEENTKADNDKEDANKKSRDKSAKDSKDTKTKKAAKKPSYSESDLRLLASLIFAEAGNQSYEGMLAVANVVLNRVKSNVYGHVNTIEEVIYDNKWAVQFAVTKKNKSGVSILDNALKSYDTGKFTGSNPKAEKEAMKQAVKAAKAALEGENNIGSYLCFNAINSGTKKIKKKYSYKIIGDHIFYRKDA